MKQLEPNAFWMFFLSNIISTFFSLSAIVIFVLISLIDEGVDFEVGFTFIPIFIFLLLVPISFIWAKLSYSAFKYEITEDAVRIERGVISKKYVSIPYERIQNVDILRGPLVRLLKLSDLQIQTAGASYSPINKKFVSEGRLPGLSVSDAEEMRNTLIQRTKESDSGV